MFVCVVTWMGLDEDEAEWDIVDDPLGMEKWGRLLIGLPNDGWERKSKRGRGRAKGKTECERDSERKAERQREKDLDIGLRRF